MSFPSRLRLAFAALALSLTTFSPLNAGNDQTARPALTSLVIQIDNGQSYSLSKKELNAKKGGVIFWGDWAVYNLMVPYYFYGRHEVSPVKAIQAWIMPDSTGQLPPFLIKTASGPVNPLEAKGKSASFSFGRPKVTSIVVGLEDGRSYSLTEEELYDEKSGVLFWGDEAVNDILVPFYYFAKDLPTSPADVINLWNNGIPVPAAASASSDATRSAAVSTLAVSTKTTPAFLVKPRCVPSSPID